jgi:isoquinoline 1-oxidoreductase beta subunit
MGTADHMTRISRRAFTLGLLASGTLAARIPATRAAGVRGVDVNHWILVAPDGAVTVRVAQMEMGAGTLTAMTQLIAEELEADPARLSTEFVDIAEHLRGGWLYGRTATAESIGVKLAEKELRVAGATLRTMLVEAAARRWNVAPAECAARSGIVTHMPTGRTLTFGEVAAEASRLRVPRPGTVRLKKAEDWSIIGKPLRRIDGPAKVDGTAIFGIDVRLPGMRHAAVAMSPTFGGSVKSYDPRRAAGMPGVLGVFRIQDGAAIAIVAELWWQAHTALDALDIEWEPGGDLRGSSDIAGALAEALDGEAAEIVRDDGDVDAAIAEARRTVTADYAFPFLDHATLEPMNCTALVTNDRFEVWAPTQMPEAAFRAAASEAGMTLGQGNLHPTLIGGGFGRRQLSDFVRQAVQIARQMRGTPIKVVWSREDTMRHGRYHPANAARLRAGLDGNGRVVAWEHRAASVSTNPVYSTIGADSLPYAVDNVRVSRAVRGARVPIGPYRGVAFTHNAFMTQCFVDELAEAAGLDCYRFQRALLDPRRMPASIPRGQLRDDLSPVERATRLRAVLDEVALKSGWDRPLPAGRGRGLAVSEQASAYFAVVAEVTLDGKGWFSTDRVVVAGDPGLLVNPDLAEAQVEGCVAFGLTTAMYGEVTLEAGSVAQGNFDTYRLLRIAEMPRIETHWLLSGRHWGGCGESVACAIIPAVVNAVRAAGGPRIRSLPLKNHSLSPRA